MTLQQFQQLIKESNFTELFISELGWNKYPSQPLPPFQIGDIVFEIDGIAERNGFQVLISYIDKLPTQTECKALDGKLRRLADSYILIFVENNTNHHLWSVPIKNNEKRQLVFVEYLTSQRLEFLSSKIDELTFDIDEKTYITDVKARVQKAFEVNSEKLTKDFYSGFQKQHKAFCQFITGINDSMHDKDNRDKQWYTSVMLNRLMFCYFIQKKGFLNNDKNYLQTKLAWCQLQKGTDQFYSFYKSFLLQLFFGGLNAPKHDTSFEQEFGRIPYLNGGMFDKHQLERDYENIDICDEAFQQLFDFFDRWEWHLDTRVTASGRDINPDVLGYIFEQYINDRAQMGAYYTKEDITEYIGKNCILPFLMDKLKEQDPDAFKPNGYVWQSLQHSGDKYIYEAVKKGANAWDEIPVEIAQGIDTTQPNLLERRAHWNEPTPEQWALPTEIWRESIERMQRCRDIQSKISNGEITEINDFITYNLDIRTFVQDLLEKTDNHLLVLHFHKALTQVSILDPTCGSGAFLFAAMNILEPLYETCINRMIEFNATNAAWFKDILADLHTKYRSNIQYYIYKTIILNNLYGVDIMHEAVEIAKLRLFLKMVAVVDVDMRADNLGIDPLPDIDFNIRCGNTLVGYATEKELHKDLVESDMFAQQEFQEKIEKEMELVAQTFKRFRGMQLTQNVDDLQEFKETKHELNTRLAELNDTLNHKMYQSITAGGQSYESWLSSHQPFHWLAEYYNIIHGNGGFDVIIGNPPYVEYNTVKNYKVRELQTIKAGNLFAYCSERSFLLNKIDGRFGFIVPISITCSKRMKPIQDLLLKRGAYFSNWGWRPSKLFDGNKSANLSLTIFLCTNSQKNFLSTYKRWYSDTRSTIFQTLSYTTIPEVLSNEVIPKIGCELENKIYGKLITKKRLSNRVANNPTQYKLYYKRTGGLYWKIFTTFRPELFLDGVKTYSSKEEWLEFRTPKELDAALCLFWSDFYWWWYQINSDVRNNNPSDLLSLPIDSAIFEHSNFKKLSQCLQKSLVDNSVWSERKFAGSVSRYKSFIPKLSKSVINEIDKVLNTFYALSEEELDFIVNYDIKYRMGTGGDFNEGEE